MKQTTVGGSRKKIINALMMTGLIVIFIAYMFPFVMVVINSLKQKRDIIKSPFSWLFTIKGLSFDNFVKAFTQMDFLNAFKNSLLVTISATALVTLLAAMLAYYIVRHKNWISHMTFALMVASMIIPFQAIMIPLVSIYGGTLNILNHRLTLIFMHTGFSMAMSVFMFHGFIKGWNIPRMNDDLKVDGWALNSEYFCSIMHELRGDMTYRSMVDELIVVPEGADTRDTEAVKRISTAYLKLLFPHVQNTSDIEPREFKRYCLDRARKMRDTIKYQLGLLDTEYSGKDLPPFSVKGLE